MSSEVGAARRASNNMPHNSSPLTWRPRAFRGASKNGIGGNASWLSSVINLVNTIVGAGVLAMPLAFSHMGVLLGIFVIIWAGLTAGFGLYLQTRCARYLDRGTASFFALSQITYPKAAVVFDGAIAIKCFGVAVSYLIIIGDLMPGVIMGFNRSAVSNGMLMDRRFWVTAFMLIVIPFSFLRRLDSLKYTSFIALVSIGYLVILVVAHCITKDATDQRGSVKFFTWESPVAALSSLPVIVFAYTCHQNMFSILNEMKTPSPRKTAEVVGASTVVSASTYILVAITGYLSFGDYVQGNIVVMYPPSVFSTIGRAAIVIMVMFSYPLQIHPCRASVDAVLKWRPRAPRHSREESPSRRAPYLNGAQRLPVSASRTEPMSEARFAIITTTIVVLSYIVAITVSSFETVLAYVGSTGSTAISFILPGLFYYKISAPDSAHHQRLVKADDDEEDRRILGDSDDESSTGSPLGSTNWRKHLLRKFSLALAIYGMVVMVVCLITNTFFIVAH